MAARVSFVDGEDTADFLADLEDVFAIAFTRDAFNEASTVGEVCDIVWSHLPPEARKGGKCVNLMAYYRLKPYLARVCPGQILTPGTDLCDLAGLRYADIEDDLRRTGWKFPGRKVELRAWLTAAATAASCFLATVIWLDGWVAIVSSLAILPVFMLSLWALHRYVLRNGTMRDGIRTVGDLSRQFGFENLKRLLGDGASLNRGMLWRLFALNLIGSQDQITRWTAFN